MSAPRLDLPHRNHVYIGGQWVTPTGLGEFDVLDSTDEQLLYQVAAAGPQDVARAVSAARAAFDDGPWPRLSHRERAGYLRAMAAELRSRAALLAEMWSRESGALASFATRSVAFIAAEFEAHAELADTFPFEEVVTPTVGRFGLRVREPVGVVGAIVPWNAPLTIAAYKLAPALLAGCTVVLKVSPEAPGIASVFGQIAESVGMPPGVLNTLTADREVSELLVRDPRVDKITFTGSTAAGRRIGALCGERVARVTLELGGKSAAVVLDDIDIERAATTLARAECLLSGQACASLTRIVVSAHRHNEMVDSLAGAFGAIRVGDPFDGSSQMGPLATAQHRDRVEAMIATGIGDGARLATGGARPGGLDRGYYVEPTVFGGVDNTSRIAQEEIFGPVLCVVPAQNEDDAVRIANDSIYGLNASVFTDDVERAREVAGRLRAGTVGHNNFRTDFGIAFGGFKQSGIGREGGREGLLPFLETKAVVLEGVPAAYGTGPGE